MAMLFSSGFRYGDNSQFRLLLQWQWRERPEKRGWDEETKRSTAKRLSQKTTEKLPKPLLFHFKPQLIN